MSLEVNNLTNDIGKIDKEKANIFSLGLILLRFNFQLNKNTGMKLNIMKENMQEQIDK